MGAPKQYTTAPEQDHEYAMNQIAPAPSEEARVTIIEASPLFSADEVKQDGPGTLPLSPQVRATLTALGMREEAFSTWETFHVSPAHAMLYFFCSMITLLCCLCYLQAFGVPFTRYSFTVPHMITITFTFCYLVSIWRMGPVAARSKLYIYSLLVPWPCWYAAAAVCFLSPMADIPFGSLTHYMFIVGVTLLSGNLANKSGLLFMDHPKHPRTSMLKPLLQSAVSTVRIIDNFTDMRFILTVMAQRQDRCMWFGEPGHCLVYKLILPALVVAAFGDLMISVGMMALGTESSRIGKGKKRALLVMHVFALVFELGIVAVTLMSLLSNMRHPDKQASPEAIAEQSDQVVATVVSLGTTLVTFVLTMVGAGDAVQGLKRIGTRISTVGKRISAAGQRLSTAGQRLSTAGQRLSTAGQRVSSVGQKMSEAGSFVVRKVSSTGRRSHTLVETGSNDLLLSKFDATSAD